MDMAAAGWADALETFVALFFGVAMTNFSCTSGVVISNPSTPAVISISVRAASVAGSVKSSLPMLLSMW